MATKDDARDELLLEDYTEDFLSEPDPQQTDVSQHKDSQDSQAHQEPALHATAEPTTAEPILTNGVTMDNSTPVDEESDQTTPSCEAKPSDAQDPASSPQEPTDTAEGGAKSASNASPLERFSQAFSMLGKTAGDVASGVTTSRPFTFLITPPDPKLSPTDLKSRRFLLLGNSTSARALTANNSDQNTTQEGGIAGTPVNREDPTILKANRAVFDSDDDTGFSENLPLLHISESGDDPSGKTGRSGQTDNPEGVKNDTTLNMEQDQESPHAGTQVPNDDPKPPKSSTETSQVTEYSETRRDSKKRPKYASETSLEKQRTNSLKSKARRGNAQEKQLNESASPDKPSSKPFRKSNSGGSLTRTKENAGSFKKKRSDDGASEAAARTPSSVDSAESDSSSKETQLEGELGLVKEVDMDEAEDEEEEEDDDDQLTEQEDQASEDKSLATFFVGNDCGPASRQNSYPDDNCLLSKHENGTSNAKTEDMEDEPVTMRHGRKSQTSILLGSLFMILSGLYGILIVVLGAVIPLTEIFVTEEGTAFEAFYIYLYSVSIAFLIYVYVYLLRRNRLRTEFLTRTLSRSISFTGRWASSWAARGSSDRSKTRKRMVSLDESNHHTGTFYLRLGVLGFGIGSMIHSGLNFGKFFGSITEGQCSSGFALLVKPLLHLIFTFSQLYFIFMNSKMCIHRKKVLARFGLMHMAATNICVWFRSIVVETLHEIHHHHAHHHDDNHHVPGHETDHVADHVLSGGASEVTYYHNSQELEESGHNLTVSVGRKLLAAAASSSNGSGGGHSSGGLLELKCSWNNMMGKAVDSAGPYLYPCTIEYSLMCAGILYVMWSNVGTRPRFRTNSEIEDVEQDRKQQRMSVDCTSSSRGLFLGIFLTVCAIISIIAFYVMVGQRHLRSEALLLTHLSETLIYCVTTFALLMATLKMRHLLFHSDHTSDLEETLIIIAYTGLLAFNIFSLIAAILMAGEEGAALTITSNFTMMLQSAFQTIFMLAGDRLSASSSVQERKKPGREYVTFLLLCNFAMWIINTFETQKPEHNPLQVAFYGPEAWSIFSHISVPLGIYYRFHSTVCLSNIWKNAWKMRKHH